MKTNRLAKLGWKILSTRKTSNLEILNFQMWQIRELEEWIERNIEVVPESVRIAVFERIDVLEKYIEELHKPLVEKT